MILARTGELKTSLLILKTHRQSLKRRETLIELSEYKPW